MFIEMTEHPTRAVIYLEALRHNLRIIRQKIGASRRILAVIKADAYGHGAIPVSTDVAGIKDIFGDLVYVYSGDAGTLKTQVEKRLYN